MVSGKNWRLAVLLMTSTAMVAGTIKQETSLEAGRHAYESSEYVKAVQALQAAAAKDPQNADVQLLLAKSYLELQQHDAAIKTRSRGRPCLRTLSAPLRCGSYSAPRYPPPTSRMWFPLRPRR